MNATKSFLPRSFLAGLACTLLTGSLRAQERPLFSGVQWLTNGELALTLTAPPGASYRIETTRDLSQWEGLVTFATNTSSSLQHIDSATPFLDTRVYRALLVTNANVVPGDHLATDNGDLIINPRNHASFVMSWSGRMIYVDPANAASFTGLPKADLILVTHSHTDHFSTSKIDSVRATNAVIIASQDVYAGLLPAQKNIAIVLSYGDSTNVLGLIVEAVPAYNSYHPLGFGNGYVLTAGGKRIYISGDTGDASELHQLAGIDVAFVCMNQPFTLTVDAATNLVTAFRPKLVYPYHYRDQSGSTPSAAAFKQRLDPALGIEVRLRKWY